MNRIVDIQGRIESGPYRTYREITALNLAQVFGISSDEADAIAVNIGQLPLFPDSPKGIKRLMDIAPCVAMSNSDFTHGEQIQNQLRFNLSDWVCAQEVRLYKPSVEFWRAVAKRRGISFNRRS